MSLKPKKLKVHKVRATLSDDKEALEKTILKLIDYPRKTDGDIDKRKTVNRYPNYALAVKGMRKLGRKRCYDALLRILEAMLDKGNNIMDVFEDNDVWWEIHAAIRIAIHYLKKSTLSKSDQMLWLIDTFLRDRTGHNEWLGLKSYIKKRPLTPSELEAVLAGLETRIQKEKGKKYGFTRYKYAQWDYELMEQAGMKERLLPFCIREAEENNQYHRLVEFLLKNDQYEDARKWVQKIAQSKDKEKLRQAGCCRSILKEYLIKKGTLLEAVPIELDDYLEYGGSPFSSHLIGLCKKAGVWEIMKPVIVEYRVSGKLPERLPEPLKYSGLSLPPNGETPELPFYKALFMISSDDEKPDEMVYWLQRWEISSQPRNLPFSWYAPALEETHPEWAIKLWKWSAESALSVAQEGWFEGGAEHLRKIKPLYLKLCKLQEWHNYLGELNQIFRDKKGFSEFLPQVA
ncbi:MAG: hypothetical protein A2487_18270 [Candidatus Raymondbacteria bacterium RifOxyC12_full_50_8]|uniref:Uncharacterized protein n=1 Tax=Candidatus Raymondbacteria bacterium RIFOXYD12_FULL_49_13 TaxID=1817890 RepID=A0A1F7F578_UNCRA|nr:MAG: hypothetical protein A2350_08310 [Candidatus Raymondbacteria bacterium RifOxyB12_full_50_8]OGJ87172.1 MAG: hypothetical protein A2248_04015 [Candidatus Raymondbacteria bacterium RIFOXYA2_FULL_49_16]OGJ95347.1 MAG: hypothetical protein A2487_18270 [Candidatus Raymondbacteria bacterium RifOxyC12_full_50_8]OGK01825.1 MAG: hypothetical protein A2519_03110 [Candidatus Raymondbacteria bacterium RIFOXYD12_FULL_49_13]OGP41168.1 MAG: hypothetical protein A2324_08660 [Candidatus Raymondbacteria b